MTIDAPVTSQAKRIAGTLHKRGYVHPAPLRDENLPRENAVDGEVPDRRQDSRQQDHNGAR